MDEMAPDYQEFSAASFASLSAVVVTEFEAFSLALHVLKPPIFLILLFIITLFRALLKVFLKQLRSVIWRRIHLRWRRANKLWRLMR
jgi:hypothetical protein